MRAGRVLLLLFLLAGCASQTPKPQMGEAIILTRTGFDALPGWNTASQGPALAAFRRSCAALMAKPGAAVMSAYAGTVADWRDVCSAPDRPDFFAVNFTPFAVEGEALFTGYYEPLIRASRTRHDQFQTPVYGLGPVPETAERAVIDAGLIDAPVLMWTDDPVTFFFLQIQGSGRAQLEDGSVTRLAYAGQNGQPYTAIGRTLIEQNELTRETVSLQTIRAWLLAHPDRAQGVMETDKSYIFFREAALDDPALGAQGTLGVNIAPLASLAVDRYLHALGAPFYVDADGPDPVQALVIAQDTGGAIKGAARGDIFFGFGQEAEARAGMMKAPGHLYVLLPRALAGRIGARRSFVP